MSKLRTILLTAAIVFPAGMLAAGPLKGHPNLQKAMASLDDADRYINASQKANEGVWKEEGGHGAKAKEAIATAKEQLRLAAEWVNKH
jgi:hypothetical protein